jgi:fatty acid desaturase
VNLQEAALHGSSHYALPESLRWFTANIGIHHVHHLCSRIPYYWLALVLRDYPADGIGRLTLFQSLRCAAGAAGRTSEAPCLVPRDAPALHFSLKARPTRRRHDLLNGVVCPAIITQEAS